MREPKTQPEAPVQERFPRSLAADEVGKRQLSNDDPAAERSTDLPDKNSIVAQELEGDAKATATVGQRNGPSGATNE